jgi:hypothetical protein
MRPFWVTTDVGLGVGVTAASEAEALALIFEAFGSERRVKDIRPIADMRELDQGHVVPNMGNWFVRGIWFPLGHAD